MNVIHDPEQIELLYSSSIFLYKTTDKYYNSSNLA